MNGGRKVPARELRVGDWVQVESNDGTETGEILDIREKDSEVIAFTVETADGSFIHPRHAADELVTVLDRPEDD